MKETNCALFKRKSIRRYKDIQVEKEKIELLLKAAMLAPSARNQQEWEFIVVDDEKIKDEISSMSPFAKSAHEAPVSIVLLADTLSLTRDAYMEQDMAACAENILIMATELGLGSVWLGVYPNKDRVKKLVDIFNLPENIIPFCVITIGYSYEEFEVRDNFDENKVHYNKYDLN